MEQDINNILKLTDILITDYSSIYFDYLLLDKPIIFAPFDFEDYLVKDRELYYNYDEVTPGPKARNWNEVLISLKEAIENPEKYKKEREKIKNIFHKYMEIVVRGFLMRLLNLYPKIYIIILNYNGWADTVECLEGKIIVIIVDNNSPSNFMKYIKAWD